MTEKTPQTQRKPQLGGSTDIPTTVRTLTILVFCFSSFFRWMNYFELFKPTLFSSFLFLLLAWFLNISNLHYFFFINLFVVQSCVVWICACALPRPWLWRVEPTEPVDNADCRAQRDPKDNREQKEDLDPEWVVITCCFVCCCVWTQSE